jgi:hypothetical protein
MHEQVFHVRDVLGEKSHGIFPCAFDVGRGEANDELSVARSSPAHCEQRVTADGVPASGSMVPYQRECLRAAPGAMSGDVAADADRDRRSGVAAQIISLQRAYPTTAQ